MAKEAAGILDLKPEYFGSFGNTTSAEHVLPLYGESADVFYKEPYFLRNNISLNSAVSRLPKRSLDITLALLAIVCLLSWLIPVLAVLIKLDSKGPVFFLQKRNGRNGKLFTCIKFRSMFVNSECDTLPAGEHDSRITRIGRFLRGRHIDELPQFFNVLAGGMSVIGPRPHMITDNQRYDPVIPHYSFRHTVKPGITGLAQVAGNVGAAADLQKMEHRVLLDSIYICNWSLMLDLRIIYRTVGVLFRWQRI